MAHDLELPQERLGDEPLILIIPGIDNSGADHWQSRWEAKRKNCRRVDLGMWDRPNRNAWVNKLNLDVHRAGRPVVLVAHSLGCLAVAWWAEYEAPVYGNPVVGALLVAPPDVDRPGTDPRLARFGACPGKPLPFPSFLVASRNDHHCNFRTAVRLASDWECRFADAGEVGHINAESDLGDWEFGEVLLRQLLRQHRLSHADHDVFRGTELSTAALRESGAGEHPHTSRPPAPPAGQTAPLFHVAPARASGAGGR